MRKLTTVRSISNLLLKFVPDNHFVKMALQLESKLRNYTAISFKAISNKYLLKEE